MLLPNQTPIADEDDYRYGFQGQEKDDEIKGEGNSLNYKYRMHDPRIGRFFAVDPLSPRYPFYSPYSFSGNRVIDATELEGLEPESVIDGDGNVTYPVIAFISSALGISQYSLLNTSWVLGTGHTVWEADQPGAITWGTTVYYSPGWEQTSSITQWVAWVGHEQSHRYDIENSNVASFYGGYISEWFGGTEYKEISTESTAYFNEGLINVFFKSSANREEFMEILNSENDDAWKMRAMTRLGLKAIRIPMLERQLASIKMKISNLKADIAEKPLATVEINGQAIVVDKRQKMLKNLNEIKGNLENEVEDAREELGTYTGDDNG